MKNTMGYGLNSFLDHTRPVDILAHLMVGSEGTLAFIAEPSSCARCRCCAHARTALLVFADLARPTARCPPWSPPGRPPSSCWTPRRCAWARPTRRPTPAARICRGRARRPARRVPGATGRPTPTRSPPTRTGVLAGLPVTGPRTLTADPRRAGRAVAHPQGPLRGGRGRPAVRHDRAAGGHRRAVPALLATCERLTGAVRPARLRRQRDLRARQGRQHPLHAHRAVRRRRPLDRFARFTEDMVDLVLGQGGTLKAEHGTGRIMAPFVRRQYGDELYAVDARDQAALRPGGMLNPGVLLTDDPDAHLRDLKPAPTGRARGRPVRGVRLLRAGVPEPGPHHHAAAAHRAAPRDAAGRGRGDTALVAAARGRLRATTRIDTCAVDGMCQTACPVLINTGDLVKRLRPENAGKRQRRAGRPPRSTGRAPRARRRSP